MNADTKIIFRNCAFDKLFVENGKVYLTDINATYIKGINNKSFALKENNEINMDMEIKAGTVFIIGDIAPTILKYMDIEKPDEMTGNNLI